MSAEPSSEIGGLPSYRLAELVAYAAKLGTIGFGGPVALVTHQVGTGGTVQLTLLSDLVSHKNSFTAGLSLDHGDTDFSQFTQDSTFTPDLFRVGSLAKAKRLSQRESTLHLSKTVRPGPPDPT